VGRVQKDWPASNSDLAFVSVVTQDLTIAEAVKETQSNEPVLFRWMGSYYVTLDSQALSVYTAGSFCDAVEFLLKLFYILNLAYPRDLKPMYGFFEQLMQLPVTIGSSVALSEFIRQL